MRNRKKADYALVDAEKLDREANSSAEYQTDAEDERVVAPFGVLDDGGLLIRLL
jgi:hypothetical protein